MIEIFENFNDNTFTVFTPEGIAYEFSTEELAVAKARELCDCTDEFVPIPFFEDADI